MFTESSFRCRARRPRPASGDDADADGPGRARAALPVAGRLKRQKVTDDMLEQHAARRAAGLAVEARFKALHQIALQPRRRPLA